MMEVETKFPIPTNLHEVAAVGLAELAAVSGGDGGGPDGVALAAVEILGLDDLVDGLALADGLERSELESALAVDLRPGHAADGDGGAAVAGNGILKGGESGALALLGSGFPVVSGAIATDAGDVQLQLTGNALLVVDDPQRLLSADFDSGDLTEEKTI